MPNKQNPSDMSGDILSQMLGGNSQQRRLLESIDAKLGQMIQDGRNMSQANAVNSYGRSSSYSYRNPKYSSFSRMSADSEDTFDVSKIEEGVISELTQSILRSRGLRGMFDSIIQSIAGPVKNSVTNATLDLLDGIEHQMKVASGKAGFSKKFQGFLSKLADDLGVETKDIKKAIGRELGKKLLGGSDDLKAVTDFWKTFSTKSIDAIKQTYDNATAMDTVELAQAQKALESAKSRLESAKKQFADATNDGNNSEVKSDSSEATESSKRQKSQNESREVNVQESSIKAQVCNITAQHIDINIDGVNLAELLKGNKVEAIQRLSRTNSEKTKPTEQLENLQSNQSSQDVQSMLEISERDLELQVKPKQKSEPTMPDAPYSDSGRNIPTKNPEERGIQSILSEMYKENEELSKVISKLTRGYEMMSPIYTSQSGYDESSPYASFSGTNSDIQYSYQGGLGSINDVSQVVVPTLSNLSGGDTLSMPSLNVSEASALRNTYSQSATSAVASRYGEMIASGDTSGAEKLKLKTLNPLENDVNSADIEVANAKATKAFTGLESVFDLIKKKAEPLIRSNKFTSTAYDGAKRSVKSETSNIFSIFNKASQDGKKKYQEELDKLDDGTLTPDKMSGLNGIISSLTGGAKGATEAGAAMSGMLSGVSGVVSKLGVQGLLAAGAFKLVTGMLKNGFAPAIEGAKKLIDTSSAALNRYHLSQKKNIEYAQKRLLEDINTLVSTPFDILRKGAEEWYSAWDNNIRTINATQGYTKSDLQDLMASFADRLRTEGLTSVVSATDITNNLTKVLQSGLSGSIAEEFAYIATKLNAAVPTQDFFGYADTYASIAANAVRTGMSQTQAIEYANQQLTAFANNVLYASREVAGGFTTGLKNAESLFKQSVQIAQTGKTYNASEISGVLTAVSAITGAIAPDLANAMTDAIYKAAVGGNNSEIVALRSLAGVNASNTEFLRELTSNPKAVFSELFSELAERQTMSADAFMEVAEGLSSIFGISAESFARVDFAYLAQAINSMDTSSKALIDNMNLLKSGETTTNAESMKMQQINKMILDDGLSYVLDNEAARAIQQHMWDEQLARELQETEYGVNLHGAALELLEGIRHAVDTITTILNPFKLLGKIGALFTSSKEDDALKEDIGKILDLGKVGAGNAQSRYNMTSYRENLKVVDDLTTMFGATSSFKSMNKVTNALDHSSGWIPGATLEWGEGGYSGSTPIKLNTAPSSKFAWRSVGKSQALAAFNSSQANYDLQGIEGIRKIQNDNEIIQDATNASTQNLQRMLNSMEGFVSRNPSASYEDWLKTSRSFGIADFSAVAKESGLTNDQISNQYALLQAQQDMVQKKERQAKEDQYWESTEKSLSSVSSSVSNEGEGGILGKVAVATNALTSISESYMNVSMKVDSIEIKMDAIKSSIDALGTSSISQDVMSEILNGVIHIKEFTSNIYGASHGLDDNRAKPTGFDLSIAGWLQFIYNKLADSIDPTVISIGENTESIKERIGQPGGYQGSRSDNLEIVQKLDTIANILNAKLGNSGYEIVNGQIMSSFRSMATAGTGY